MSVRLSPPRNRGGGLGPSGYRPEPLTHGPRYIRTRGMGRWHRVRSGVRYPAQPEVQWGEGLGYAMPPRPARDAWQAWCGQSVSGTTMQGKPYALTRDRPPVDGLPVCGTCEGRAVGAGYSSPVVTVADGTELLFEPAGLQPPRKCPGSGKRGENLWAKVNNRVGRCLACGELMPIRYGGGPYDPWAGLVSHEPAPGLFQPCPFHGWDNPVRRSDDTVTCYCSTPPDARWRRT